MKFGTFRRGEIGGFINHARRNLADRADIIGQDEHLCSPNGRRALWKTEWLIRHWPTALPCNHSIISDDPSLDMGYIE